MRLLCLLLLVGGIAARGAGQATLQSMPRFDRYSRLNREIETSVVSGGVPTTWAPDSKSFFYTHLGKTYRYDLKKRKAEETEEAPPPNERSRNGRRIRPVGLERGRQYVSEPSPNGKLRATARDRNVYVSDADGKNEVAVTTDGSVASRTKYGVADWVYGEELEVHDAMWWSPDSSKLAFYRFDESEVKDYFVTLDEGQVQNRLDTEPYPKAGSPNPKAELFIYDLATRKTAKVGTTSGDASLGEYVYDVRWAEDSKALLFNRTDRKQKVMQLCLASPTDGAIRIVVEERQPQSWAENHPEILFLKDGHRFIWASERNGFKNYYLYDLNGKLLKPLTGNAFDAESIADLDEAHGVLYYTSSGADNPYLRQLHRVKLDGTHDTLLTDSALDHEVSISPNGSYFTDVAQRWDVPPETRLVDSRGKIVDTFLKSDTTKFDSLKLKRTELFQFLAPDRRTTLYGYLQFPSDFDPTRSYPVLLSVYGGPESGGLSPRFQTPQAVTEMGFLFVSIAGRGTMARGKAFRDAVYGKLGEIEIDDQNAGILSLASRPYVDLKRVGVFGTSYGGYSTVMLLLRHPETFAAGCASSSVTDWHNYDSIYTERYMGLPADGENKAGYESGSAMKYAANLKGKLMLYFGSADNNVHPSNTYQLVSALNAAGREYDLQVGTDRGHTGMNMARMWEYFVTHLILEPRENALDLVWNQRKARLRAKP